MNSILKVEKNVVDKGPITWNLKMVKSCHRRRERADSEDEKKDDFSNYTDRSSINSVALSDNENKPDESAA